MEMFSPDEDDVVSITDEERGIDTGGTQDSEIVQPAGVCN